MPGASETGVVVAFPQAAPVYHLLFGSGYAGLGALKGKLTPPIKHGFRYAPLHKAIRGGIEDIRLKNNLLLAIHSRHRASCTTSKLAKVVKASIPKTRQALSDLEAADYIASGGTGFLPTPGRSLTARGRELLARVDQLGRPQEHQAAA